MLHWQAQHWMTPFSELFCCPHPIRQGQLIYGQFSIQVFQISGLISWQRAKLVILSRQGNFLSNGGDMLRLNMAVPVTQRNDPNFSPEGLIQAAVLGLTNPAYNTSTSLQFIPNMDGFPNGRRLEDDVTRIELQAVSGIVLAAVGLFYDDYTIGGNPVTPDLLNVLTYTTGIEHNDTTFKGSFPYVQAPWSGYDY